MYGSILIVRIYYDGGWLGLLKLHEPLAWHIESLHIKLLHEMNVFTYFAFIAIIDEKLSSNSIYMNTSAWIQVTWKWSSHNFWHNYTIYKLHGRKIVVCRAKLVCILMWSKVISLYWATLSSRIDEKSAYIDATKQQTHSHRRCVTSHMFQLTCAICSHMLSILFLPFVFVFHCHSVADAQAH